MSVSCTLPVNRAEIGPILTAAVAFIWSPSSLSRLSQPGMLTLSTSVSFSASHTVCRGAGMRRSPVISMRIRPLFQRSGAGLTRFHAHPGPRSPDHPLPHELDIGGPDTPGHDGA